MKSGFYWVVNREGDTPTLAKLTKQGGWMDVVEGRLVPRSKMVPTKFHEIISKEPVKPSEVPESLRGCGIVH